MGFRQKNDQNHQWARFCRANMDLMLSTGIPLAVVEDHYAFTHFAEHKYASYTDGAGRNFTIDKLAPEQRKQFLPLAVALIEAGFESEAVELLSNAERMLLAKKFPGRFNSRWWYHDDED